MRTSDETIRELERLNAERTQGEWRHESRNGRAVAVWIKTDDRDVAHGCIRGDPDNEWQANVEAIAAAVNALPNLLADIRDLAAMERERDDLRAELAEWKAAFRLDDREGGSRLMARAMGQALDAAVRERDEARAALKEIGHCELLCHCCKATLDAAIGGQG